jgi:hypothetical protein
MFNFFKGEMTNSQVKSQETNLNDAEEVTKPEMGNAKKRIDEAFSRFKQLV